jgi:hypothetical protein
MKNPGLDLDGKFLWPMGRPWSNPFTLLAQPAQTLVKKKHLGNSLKKTAQIPPGHKSPNHGIDGALLSIPEALLRLFSDSDWFV